MSDNSNLRLFLNCLAETQACKRDHWIEQVGICVTALIPVLNETEELDENQVDFFGDPCIENRKSINMWLVPNYDQYYSLLNIMGEDLEEPIPMECLVKTTDHWPRETIFKLPVLHANNQMVDRYWKVINSEGKHLEVYYNRQIQVVPARNTELEGIV